MSIPSVPLVEGASLPVVPGLPLLGNGLDMMGDIQAFFVKNYQRFGPVFKARALQQQFTILAGVEANQLLRDRGEEIFTSEESMGGLADQFDMRVHVLQGEAHQHLRSILGKGLSPEILNPGWDGFLATTNSHTNGWGPGTPLPVVDMFQRLASDQLAVLLGSQSSAPHFPQLRFIFELMLEATLAKKWPMFVLRLPAYRNAKAQVETFIREVAEAHRNAPNRAPDMVDVALAALDEHGQPYSEAFRLGMIKQAYFAGINTVAYLCSFALYAFLHNPHVHTQVLAEVDVLFKDGMPSLDAFRQSKVLRNWIMESLRMYPPAPASSRTVKQAFNFAGYHIPAGTRILAAVSVTHFLPDIFPNPAYFDLSRENFYENRSLGAYAPFSLGAHTCLGQSLGQVQALVTLAILVHRFRFTFASPNYQMHIQAAPGPHPDAAFKVIATLR